MCLVSIYYSCVILIVKKETQPSNGKEREYDKQTYDYMACDVHCSLRKNLLCQTKRSNMIDYHWIIRSNEI